MSATLKVCKRKFMAMEKSEDTHGLCKGNVHNDDGDGFNCMEQEWKNEKRGEEPSDVSDVTDYVNMGKKDSLLKQLISILSKKSSLKPNTSVRKHVAPNNSDYLQQVKQVVQVNSDPNAKHNLCSFDFLLAQAEATLRELVVKASCSRPSLFKNREAPTDFNGSVLTLTPRKPGYRWSSRIWQHVGGKILCGASSSFSAAIAETTPLPMPYLQKHQGEGRPLYFRDETELEDGIYWRESLAEAALVLGNDNKKYVLSHGKLHGEDGPQQLSSVGDITVSEIQEEAGPSNPVWVSIGRVSSRTSASFDSSQSNLRQSTRLNTRLEDSPHLIHNSSSKQMRAMRIDESSSSSSSLWTSLASTSGLSHSSSSLRLKGKEQWFY